jgi:hypothetical protein
MPTTANHLAMQLAMRNRLAGLTVATTGATSLSATTTGYARTAGSFLADGFAPGMEVTPAGFAANPVATIRTVTALELTVSATRAAETAAAGRSLVVGLPALRAWENGIPVVPPQGAPYVEEQYIPGPAFVPEVGPDARVEARPMYAPRIFVQAATGISGDSRYADSILALFPRGLTLTCSDGTVLCVRSDVAPFRGQRLPGVAVGWSCIPITIPFYTLN